jgi:hypothetical protein
MFEFAHDAVHGWSLHYGHNGRALAIVAPDPVWPRMWRIHWPDGRVSDVGNLTRMRDAAGLLACGPHRHPRKLNWKRAGPDGHAQARGAFQPKNNPGGRTVDKRASAVCALDVADRIGGGP